MYHIMAKYLPICPLLSPPPSPWLHGCMANISHLHIRTTTLPDYLQITPFLSPQKRTGGQIGEQVGHPRAEATPALRRYLRPKQATNLSLGRLGWGRWLTPIPLPFPRERRCVYNVYPYLIHELAASASYFFGLTACKRREVPSVFSRKIKLPMNSLIAHI